MKALKKALKALPLLAAAVTMAGCASTFSYYGPDYVGSRLNDKVKSVEQHSLGHEVADKMTSAYDEEFIHDEKGNLLKFRQTEYVSTTDEANKQFIVWETEYKVLGGHVVPVSISVNGVPFIECDYEVLKVKAEGAIKQETLDRRFAQIERPMIGAPVSTVWYISLGAYVVNFDSDDKFITTDEDKDNVLTLGYDNIALKSFKFSREKKQEGLSKTNGYYNSSIAGRMAKGSSVTFSYDWKVVADKICQAKMNFDGQRNFQIGSSVISVPVNFTAEAEYDAAGNRTHEAWYVTRQDKKGDVKTVVFEENLKY